MPPPLFGFSPYAFAADASRAAAAAFSPRTPLMRATPPLGAERC